LQPQYLSGFTIYFINIANNKEGPWRQTTYCDGGETFDPLLVDKTTNA
jgi:hypothetical protein